MISFGKSLKPYFIDKNSENHTHEFIGKRDLANSSAQTKAGAAVFPRPPCSRRLTSTDWLNRARSPHFYTDHRYCRHSHARDIHPHPRTNRNSRGRHDHRTESHGGNANAGDLGLDPGTVGFQSSQGRLLASRHHLELGKFSIRLLDSGLNARQGICQRTSRAFAPCGQNPSLADKLVGVPGGQSQHGATVIFHAIHDLVRPLQAAVVVAGVQSGCENRRRQPSPCLYFHDLNPLCLIDEGRWKPLATEDTESACGKFPPGGVVRSEEPGTGVRSQNSVLSSPPLPDPLSLRRASFASKGGICCLLDAVKRL